MARPAVLTACITLMFVVWAPTVAPHAQPTSTAPMVWTGEWVERYSDPDNGVRSETTITYRLTEGLDAYGNRVWTARSVTWSYRWVQEIEGTKVVGQERLGVNRSADIRVQARLVRTCTTAGTADLGPRPALDLVLLMPPGQEDRLQASCTGEGHPKGDRIGLPGVPSDEELRGCSYEKPWHTPRADGSSYTGNYRVTRGPDLTARVIHFSTGFVPSPGATFRIEARASVPARWKFVLQSSRLRGYATNADVDLAFFEIFNLPALRGRYHTMDPDLIFDPAMHESTPSATSDWQRPSPDSGPAKWSVLESKESTNSIEATVTAMDFGAHGNVTAYVSSCAGAWTQVTVDESTGANSFLIPPDSDGNFMADPPPGRDALKEYHGIAPLDDTDSDPSGKAPGDGLTAFEEYRGFMLTSTYGCSSPVRVHHSRTDPRTKDLFVHASDPLLRKVIGASLYVATGLDIRWICPAQYLDDDTRIVNFTMQVNPGASLTGAPLTQDFPQHGLHLTNEPLVGRFGRSIGRRGPGIGPPLNIDRVVVDVTAVQRSVPAGVDWRPFVRQIAIHEIGHGVGITHHGDGNLTNTIVLLRLPACPPGTLEGTVAGDRACLAPSIVVPHGQNSGDENCPMKYARWEWYLPDGVSARSVGLVDFRPMGSFSWWRQREHQGYLLTGGTIKKYRKALDDAATLRGAWKFCSTTRGTGINALPGDQNHAGDGSRSCTQQLVVSDRLSAP